MEVSAPPTAAPTPTNAICPRLTWPAHPVSTTSEEATIANRTMIVARLSRLFDIHSGRVSTNTPMTAHIPNRTARTSGSPASSRGMGRTSRAACQVEAESVSTRPVPLRRTSSRPTSTIRNRTASL